MCDKLGINVWNVIEAAATKPYGFMKFTPGPGIGGHCIPADPQYLAWKLRSLNYEARFVGLAEEINIGMQSHVLDKVILGLNNMRKPVFGSKIICLGVAYKPDVGDVRDSPAIGVMERLIARGGLVEYNDPYVPTLSEESISLKSIELTDEELQAADCVIALTAHSTYDWSRIIRNSSLLIDTRNISRGIDAGNCQVIGI